jgi:hypothetical protein
MSLLIAGQGATLSLSGKGPFSCSCLYQSADALSFFSKKCLPYFTTSLLYIKNPAQGRVRKQCGHWQKPYLLLAFLALCILLCFGLVIAVELLCIVLFCVTVVDEGWVAVFDVED